MFGTAGLACEGTEQANVETPSSEILSNHYRPVTPSSNPPQARIIAKKRKDGWSVRATGGCDSLLFEDVFDDLDSQENELALEVRYTLSQWLVGTDVDAKAREIIWNNGERLSIRESIERLSQGCPQYPFEMVELQFVFWLMEFSPESYSQAQSDEYEALTERWLDEYSRQHGLVL